MAPSFVQDTLLGSVVLGRVLIVGAFVIGQLAKDVEIAVALATRAAGASRVLTVVSAVFALGLLLPPVGWAVTYLMAFWFAGVGIWLSRRG